MFDQKKKKGRERRKRERDGEKILEQRKLWWDESVILCLLIPAVAVLLGATQCMYLFLFSGSKHYLCLTCTSKVIILDIVNENNWIGRKPPTLSEGFALPDIQCI